MAPPPRVLVVTAGLLLVVALVAGCASAGESARTSGGIATTGTGRIAVPPDVALVALGAEARAPRLGDATADVERRMRGVIEALRTLDIHDADVRTINYSIQPLMDMRSSAEASPHIAGYRVLNVVQVRVRGARDIGRVAEAAVTAGANVVLDVHFTVEDPTRAEAEARAHAVDDAAGKARQLATAAGVRLGRALSITESPGARPVARLSSVAASPGPVEPGQLDVTVSVEVRYAIEPP